MGQFRAVAVGTPRPTSGATRKLVLGALASGGMAMAALSSAGVAHATCASMTNVRAGEGCLYQHVGPGRPSRSANTSTATAGALPGFEIGDIETASAVGNPGDLATASAVGNPVAVAESMLDTDAFGPYGCEDFVDAAYGRTTATGIGHDAALSFYQSLADRGLARHEMPVPRGALVFSSGPDGGHVDISRGDGTYVSGGVQGLSPGYGNGHNVQILPAPNLGSWTLDGWAYPPW